jgi:hypothetical protein
MFSKPLAVGLLALSCVTAAAGGAYVAVRQNTDPAPASSAATTSPAPAVRETEAVVTPATPAPTAEPVESPRATPVSSTAPATAATSGKTPAIEPARTRRAEPSPKPAGRTPAPAARTAAPVPATEPVAAPSLPAETSPARVDNPAPPEPVRPEPARVEPAAPAPPEMIEVVVPSASVIGLQIESPVSSERARIEDRVEAKVMRDVSADGRTAIPAGTRAIGSVTLVERGGKVKERARLGVRFHTLVMADGTQLPIRTEAILREGESPTGDSARKIGGAAVGGAILGAIMGGKKGAIVGGATGAAGGTAVVMAGDRNAATLPVGAVVTVRLSSPLSIEVERQQQ